MSLAAFEFRLVFLFLGFGHGWKELDSAPLNGQGDPAIHEFTEPFIDNQTFLQLRFVSGSDKATDRLPSIHVGEFVVGAVTLGVFRVHTSATGAATDLVLTGYISRVHGAERLQLFLNAPDFLIDQ